MTNPEDYRIPKLADDNYAIWSARAQAGLDQKDYWEAIDPGYGVVMTAAEKRINSKAKNYITLIVSDEYVRDIKNCARAKEAWDVLAESCTKQGLLHYLDLLGELFTCQMKDGEKMREFWNRFMIIYDKLVLNGNTFSDREVAHIILRALPKKYAPLILHLEKESATLTSQTLKPQLILEEERLERHGGEPGRGNGSKESEDDARALYTKNGGRQKKDFARKDSWRSGETRRDKDGEGDRNPRYKFRCYGCGETGHMARNCPHNTACKKGTSSSTTTEEQPKAKRATERIKTKALMVKTDNCLKSYVWCLDSGATDHMTSDRSKLQNIRPIETSVEVANSEKIQVSEAGSLSLRLSDKNGGWTITLERVLYVPGLEDNLLSVARVEEKGMHVSFRDGKASVIDEDQNVILVAHRDRGLYQVEEEVHYAKLSKAQEVELLHRRLGHLHLAAVKNVIKRDMLRDELCNESQGETTSETDSSTPPVVISIENEQINTDTTASRCDVCMRGKLKRLPFKSSESPRASRALELVHSDVVGPMNPTSKGGSRYFALFTDDFSNFVKVYFFKKKSEVFQKFCEFRVYAENVVQTKMGTLRSDNGGEYKSAEFDEFLKANGIKRQLTVPRTPQQNGKAERQNQTIMDTTRCLLIEAGMPHHWWAEAVHTACYVRNRCPSSAIEGQTPEELWTGKKANSDHLRVFGCQVWCVADGTKRRTKLDPKGIKCVFIGYSDETKGYKVWDPDKDEMFLTRNVLFEEDVLPLRTLPGKKGNMIGGDDEKEIRFRWDDRTESVAPEPCAEPPDPEAFVEGVEPPDPEAFVEEVDRRDQGECQLFWYSSDDDEVDRTEMPLETTVNVLKRSQRQAAKRDYQLKCNLTKSDDHAYEEPNNVYQALRSPEAKEWKAAIEEELANMEANKTWMLVPRPQNRRVITSRWVFKRKMKLDGNIARYKARLVARGCSQVYGIDFTETYSPVIKHKSLRLLIAIAVEWKWEIFQMDVTAAYLKGKLKEEIFMEIPETGEDDERVADEVCLLQRTIYGLKQSGREWNLALNEFLTSVDLSRSCAEPCVYHNVKMGIMVGVYVDDLVVIVKSREAYARFRGQIQEIFDAKDLGEVGQLLAMDVRHDVDGSCSIDLTNYIEELIGEYQLNDAKEVSTPLDPTARLKKGLDFSDPVEGGKCEAPYREAVGSLTWVACMTRPDISHPAARLGQFNEEPSTKHWNAVKRVLRFLKKTKRKQLKYQKTGKLLQIFADADWAGDIVDRRSYSGFVVILAGGAVSWSSKKQGTTALSTVEAEFIAMCHVSREVLWITNLLREIGAGEFVDSPTKIFCDNQGAIALAGNQMMSERSKHISLQCFFLRDLVEKKRITFQYIPSELNPADIMTKPVRPTVLVQHCEKCGLADPSE